MNIHLNVIALLTNNKINKSLCQYPKKTTLDNFIKLF